MPNSFGSYAYAAEEFAGPPVANSPYVSTNQGLFPLVMVELGLGYGSLAEPVTWTDVSRFVTRWTTNRGRQHVLGKFEAGTATVTLTNADGRFSPFNTSGPYAPNLLPGVPIRIRAVWGAVTFPVFRGTVEAWPSSWSATAGAEVTVRAVDATKLLAGRRASTLSTYAATVLADLPYLYWRLGDQAGAVSATDLSGNGRPGTPTIGAGGSVPAQFGTVGAIVADSDSGFDCGESTGLITATVSLLQNSVSVEFWAKVRSLPSSGFEGVGAAAQLVTLTNTGGVDQQIGVNVNSSFTFTDHGSPYVHLDNGLGSVVNATSQTRILYLAPYHIRVERQGKPLEIDVKRWRHFVVTSDGANVVFYVDGVQQLNRSFTASAALNKITAGGFDGTIDEVAVYNYPLSAARVAAHYQAGVFPRLNELSGARIGAYLDAIAWPSTLRKLDAGSNTLQAATDDALKRTALANMSDASDTEGGALFVDAAGNVAFFDRGAPSRSPYSQVSLILGDSGVAPEEPYLVGETAVTFDDVDLYNEIVVTPAGLGGQVAADATSQARYGKRTLSINTVHASTADAAVRAASELARYKDPAQRIEAVTVTPMSDPTMLFGPVLGSDMFTRLRVRRRPMDGSSSTFDQVALIEGVSHDVTKSAWKTTWSLSSTDAL